MTPAAIRELLTAAVDGELTPAERRSARRLLQESEAARVLYAQLKADAARIKALPRVPAPPDLAANVLSVIRDRALTPTPLPPSRPTPRFNWAAMPVWVNFATAACVMLFISIGSYLYFAATQPPQHPEPTAVSRSRLPRFDDHRSVARGPVLELGPVPRLAADPPVGSPDQVVQAPVLELGPSPRTVTPRFDTAPIHDAVPEIEPFPLDKIRISQFFNLHDLPGDAASRKKLATEMKKDELIRLDLFCQTTQKALEPVLTALRARNVTSVTDTFVQERLKRKQSTEIMIFTEALTPDEVAQFLADLGAADAKAGAGEFSTLVAAPFLPADLDRLGKLLGLPPVLPKPAAGAPSIDIRKPLPEGTAVQVAATLNGMGSASKAPRKAEKVAVVVAYSPANPSPTGSREIKQFLERRGDRRPDAKPLMLVLRTVQ